MCCLFPTEQTGYTSEKVHDTSWNTERNVNTEHDVIFDVIIPINNRKIIYSLNVVQHVSIQHVSMEIDIFFFAFFIDLRTVNRLNVIIHEGIQI